MNAPTQDDWERGCTEALQREDEVRWMNEEITA
jgi:hypothetical protein